MDEWEMVRNIKPCTVVASGRLLEVAEKACEGLSVGLINARKLCPLGQRELRMLDGAKTIITVEDGSRDAGFGAQLARLACAEGRLKVLTLGVPSFPITAATPHEQDELCGLTAEQIRQIILKNLY